MRNRPVAILSLIAVNAIFYVITHLVPGMEEKMVNLFGLYFPRNDHFVWWQLVTNMFMHGGFYHILFNMYALWAFGSPLEMIWGKRRFLLFYFLSGIGAGVIYTLVNVYQFNNLYDAVIATGISAADVDKFLELANLNSSVVPEPFKTSLLQLYWTPAVGASGAIYGVLVAFGMLFPNAKLALIFLPVPIAAKYFIPVLIALDLFSGITGFSIFGGGIAHFAHIGGAIIGFLLMWYWRKIVPARGSI
jgi:membrane associated rhomboid family serine protease